MILFAAIPIPYGLTQDLVRLQKGVAGARWRPPDYFHITLCYYGDVDDDRAEELDRRLAEKVFPSFELTVRGAGHFGHTSPHAIWMGVRESDALARLHEHCKTSARRTGLTVERRLYRPHITMAYLREGVDPERIIRFEQRLAEYESAPFLVDRFELWSSHKRKNGPNLYRSEATYPLGG